MFGCPRNRGNFNPLENRMHSDLLFGRVFGSGEISRLEDVAIVLHAV